MGLATADYSMLFTDESTRCRQFCNCQSLKEPQDSIAFNQRPATTSMSITYIHQISTGFSKHWHLVRDYVRYLFSIQIKLL